MKIPQEDLLGYEYGLRKGAVFQPSYFVSYDRGREAIVMGIRGTWVSYINTFNIHLLTYSIEFI